MAFKLFVNQKILDMFPDYRAMIIYASGVNNMASTAQTTTLLREAEEACRDNFGNGSAREHPHIQSWRNAMSRFGAKPKKYPCSAEALIKRVLSGDELPSINALVDIYNAISVRYVLPIGGEDRDQLASDLELRIMDGTETFETTQGGKPYAEQVNAGEIAWCDDKGVTCRRWNWRQGRRTALTTETSNIYFVLDRLAPYEEETMVEAAAELEQRILDISPSTVFAREVLGG